MEKKNKKILSFDDLINGCATKEELYELPNGAIKIRGLTKSMAQQIRADSTDNGELNADKFELATFKAGIIEPQISDEQLELIKDSMPASVFDDICYKILGLSGISTPEIEEAKKFFRS